ncbi:DUF4231 domain-containing protein [Streptomyces griseocarneus]|uniref:DUF4231 domain-containing protein n=1 Tax=Streptomyces griseocarneus TaxID=51201 RepID=UPI001CCE8008|nr:DUF4231 domain-containing protein [Streptomyces griseocarneus]MBZ6475765.1 DUF4231 domain-containing protein [Streptomyces griseocarneus]
MDEAGETAAAAAEAWDRQSVWSQAANRLKRTIERARTASLLLGIAGALLGTAASQTLGERPSLGRVLAFVAAVAVGLVPVVGQRAGPQAVQRWTRARSAGEALKNEVYTCLAGVAPYRGAGAGRMLRERTDRVDSAAADLLPHTRGIRPVTRGLPAVSDVDSYVALRVRRQIDGYYRPKAEEMGRRVTAVRRVEFALGAAGAVLGALAGGLGAEGAAAWVAVVVTVGAAVSAHGVAAKYAFQEMEYARTADELRRLVARRGTGECGGGGPAADDAFVARCERVISVLNDTWMIKWTTE